MSHRVYIFKEHLTTSAQTRWLITDIQGKAKLVQTFPNSAMALVTARQQGWTPRVLLGNQLWLITPYLHGKKHPAWGTSSLKQAQREARQWLNQQKTPHTKLRSNLFAAGCVVLEHPQQGCIARIEITSRVMARKE